MHSDLSLSDDANFELEWSIFHAALRSYKSELYLGSEIIEYGTKDTLEKVWNEIWYCKRNKLETSKEVQRFHETVLEKQNFKLSLISTQETNDILDIFLIDDKTSDNFDKSKIMMFKVTYGNTERNDLIRRFSDQYGSFLALHGSPVNRFYSILQKGLHLPKSSDEPGLYGFGIYLTNKLNVALNFAQAHLFDCGWLKDESIKIVAVCQVAKHPTTVVRKEHQCSDGFSFAGGIPPEYYLVKDECMVQVTHVMVETSCQVSFLQSRARKELECNTDRRDFIESVAATFRRYWLFFTITAYIGILMLIAVFNGRCTLFSDWDNSDLLNIDD